jgi:hypothetical protein
MNSNVAPNDLKRLWQSQKPELPEVALDEMRKRAQRYRRKIRRRNALEYVALTVVVVFLGFVIWKFSDPLTRTGVALCIAACVYMGHEL